MPCTFQNLRKRFIICIILQHAIASCLAHSSVSRFQLMPLCNDTYLSSQEVSWPKSAIHCAMQCSTEDSCFGFYFDDSKICRLLGQDILYETQCYPGLSIVFIQTGKCINSGDLLPDNSCVCLDGYIGASCEMVIEDCSDGFNHGFEEDGIYWIQPRFAPEAFQVHCQMFDGAGSTIIQNRSTGSDTFNRTWDDYKHGFYEASASEFWLGNDKIHWITAGYLQVLTVKPTSSYLRCFDNFYMASESHNFAVTYRLPRHPTYDVQMRNCEPTTDVMFSTYDRDNDASADNCASLKGRGFWFPDLDCSACDWMAGDIDSTSDANKSPEISSTTVMALRRIWPLPGSPPCHL